MNKYRKRIEEKLKNQSFDRKVTPVLNVRFVDAEKPDQVFKFTFWRPTDEVFSALHEGNCVEIQNAWANGSKNKVINVIARSNTRIRKLTHWNTVNFEPFARKLTQISQIDVDSFNPLCSEFDIMGVVISIEYSEYRKINLLYLSDVEGNVIKIHFWLNFNECPYEKIVKVKNTLCLNNVQWRPFERTSNGFMPNGFVTDYTVLSQEPKHSSYKNEFRDFKSKLAKIDLNKLIANCEEEKIRQS